MIKIPLRFQKIKTFRRDEINLAQEFVHERTLATLRESGNIKMVFDLEDEVFIGSLLALVDYMKESGLVTPSYSQEGRHRSGPEGISY